jgi:phosphatidylglycerol:prolipoprotein diacylglycerol transferase
VIFIGVNPVAFTIGFFSLRWYAVMVILAIIFLVGWVLYFGKQAALTTDFAISAAVWAIPLGFIGAKLVHVVDNLDYYITRPGQIASGAGLAIFGAILGAILGLYIHCRLKRVAFAPIADMAAPGIILAQAIGRIGCTINGCCYGMPSSLPWAVTWTHPNTYAPLGIPVHPTQVYELLWDLVVFAILWWLLRRRLTQPGTLFAAYLALYSLGSFSIRFLRGDVSAFTGIFNEGQVISLVVLAVAAGYLLRQRYQATKRATVGEGNVYAKDK